MPNQTHSVFPLSILLVGWTAVISLAQEPLLQRESLADFGAGVEMKDGQPWRVQLTDQFDRAGLALLEKTTSIEELDLRFCSQLQDEDFVHFSELIHLRKLSLPNYVGDQGVQYLQGLVNLEVLHFINGRLTAEGMAHLRRLTKLEDLGLWQCKQITDEGFQHLRGMNNLKRLDLRRCELLTDDCLKHVRNLTMLETLDVSVIPGITNKGMRRIARLTNLKELSTTRTSISDLSPVVKLTKLESLNVPDVIDDAQLVHLEKLTKLQRLSLEVTRITDDGVAHLRNLHDLQWLDIHKTAITDACLHHLQGLPNLRYLQLQETRVTKAGYEQTAAALPQCEVIAPWHAAY